MIRYKEIKKCVPLTKFIDGESCQSIKKSSYHVCTSHIDSHSSPQLIITNIHENILRARDEIMKRQGSWTHDDMAAELTKDDYCPRTVERYVRLLVSHGYITRIKPGVYI